VANQIKVGAGVFFFHLAFELRRAWRFHYFSSVYID
jgi:hypothetical protein